MYCPKQFILWVYVHSGEFKGYVWVGIELIGAHLFRDTCGVDNGGPGKSLSRWGVGQHVSNSHTKRQKKKKNLKARLFHKVQQTCIFHCTLINFQNYVVCTQNYTWLFLMFWRNFLQLYHCQSFNICLNFDTKLQSPWRSTISIIDKFYVTSCILPLHQTS